MTKHNRLGEGGTKVYGKKGSGILFTDGKAMLLLKRSEITDHSGTWALPGGKSKEGETEIGTAVRETKEETGLDSIPGYRFDSETTHNGKQKFTVFFYKVSRPFDVEISEEHSEWDWIDFDELKGIELHPKFKQALPDYLRRIRRKAHSFMEWAAATQAAAHLSN